jgi:hypothetical protein
MYARPLLFVALLVALTACGQKEASPAADQLAPSNAASPAAVRAAAPPPQARAEEMKASKPSVAEPNGDVTTASTAAQLTSSSTTYSDGERKFIRTGNASFLVKDVYQSALAIEDAAASLGGFVTRNDIGAEVRQTQHHPGHDGSVIELAEYEVRGQLEIRVPSQKTQAFLRAIVGQIVFLDKRSFTARDAQFDLLRQQLEAQRNQETQLDLQQLGHEGGKVTQKAEIIETRNQTKADRDNARVAQKEFEDQIAFSTVSLTIYQQSAIRTSEKQDIDQVFRQNRPSIFVRLADALRAGWDHLIDTAVWFVEDWPYWLIAVAVIAGVHRLNKRRMQTKAAEHPQP